MSKEFIIVITNHRKLGELFVPYLIDRKPGQSFFQLNDIATSENTENFPEQFKKLVKILFGVF